MQFKIYLLKRDEPDKHRFFCCYFKVAKNIVKLKIYNSTTFKNPTMQTFTRPNEIALLPYKKFKLTISMKLMYFLKKILTTEYNRNFFKLLIDIVY